MNTNDLTTRVNNLENALNVLLEAVGDQLSPSQVQDVQEALNPPTKLTEAQQEAQDVVLLKAHYGVKRYEEQFAGLSAGEKRLESWKVFG